MASHVDRGLRVRHILIGVDGEDGPRVLPPRANRRAPHGRGLVGGDHLKGLAVPHGRPLGKQVDGRQEVEAGVLAAARVGVAVEPRG